jgi:hypothetical protein
MAAPDETAGRLDDDGPTTKGRAYVHAACGSATVVSGNDYTRLVDPYSAVQMTFCVRCSNFALLTDVAWRDTGETIADYRRRMREETPTAIKLWRFLLGPALGALAGAAVGFVLTLMFGVAAKAWAGGLVGGLLGAGVAFGLMPALIRAIAHFDYRRVR